MKPNIENLTINVPLTVDNAIAELSVTMGLDDEGVKSKFEALGMPQFSKCIVIFQPNPDGFKVLLYDLGQKEPRHGYGVDNAGQVWD